MWSWKQDQEEILHSYRLSFAARSIKILQYSQMLNQRIIMLFIILSFIHGIFIFLCNLKPWMFSEDYKRGVCLDDLDVGLDWNVLIIIIY